MAPELGGAPLLHLCQQMDDYLRHIDRMVIKFEPTGNLIDILHGMFSVESTDLRRQVKHRHEQMVHSPIQLAMLIEQHMREVGPKLPRRDGPSPTGYTG